MGELLLFCPLQRSQGASLQARSTQAMPLSSWQVLQRDDGASCGRPAG